MNDTERDLRELFESKARDAGAPTPVTPEVLRRGRRRQLGTVAVAGLTALAVAAAAVVSLQAVNRADTDSVPGGPQGNPAFTAIVQNFTLTVPEGWTLIDQWPLALAMPVATSSSGSFSCAAEAIPAGRPNAMPSPVDGGCPEGTQISVPAPEPPMIPRGGLPLLTLSNTDLGLLDTVCDADRALPPTTTALYIGLDYGITRVAGWEDGYPVDRGPLENVLEGDLPIDQMPCGPGGYSRFQAAGLPWFVWAGFGSEVTDVDRQAVADAFDGMAVSEGELTNPVGAVPGYVVAGGTIAGTPWTLEASQGKRSVALALRSSDWGLRVSDDFAVPERPIDLETVHDGSGFVFGAVTFDAARVELRPSDGSDPVPGSVVHLPGSLGAPFDAFVVPSAVDGEVAAIGADGDLGSVSVGRTPAEPTAPPTSVTSDGMAAGQSNGVDWNLVLDGERLVLTDTDGVELGQASLQPETTMSAGSYVFGAGPNRERIVFGVIEPPAGTVWPAVMDLTWRETTLLPSVPGVAGGSVVYFLTFPDTYAAGVWAIREPCDILTGYDFEGNEVRTPQTLPVMNCSTTP